MAVQTFCPHCDSKQIEQLPDRSYESTSSVTWFQCRACRRMWSLPKIPHTPGRPDNENSPDS